MRIELRDVSKAFGRVQALSGITATIPSGSRLALIGPNGSGKSTLLRCVLGLMTCEGQVLVDGRSPYDDRVHLTRQLAYVPQIAPQLAAPVAEILRMVCVTRELPETRVRDVAARLGLSLEKLRRQPFRTLSGGTRQKVLLSIALAVAPRLLVLDEPTASLDAAARERFFGLFAELSAETTLILCSHRLEELRQLVDHVLALEGGRVTYQGPAHAPDLVSGQSMVERLLEQQQASLEVELGRS